MFLRRVTITVILLWLIGVCGAAHSQAPPSPYPPQVQPPPQAPGTQPPPGFQQPLEYAFRPELTNPEYGQCLAMEKQWKDLWNQYNQLYHQARMLNPRDPRYAQMTYYLYDLKRRLDGAWNNFAARCVYFGSRDRPTSPQQ